MLTGNNHVAAVLVDDGSPNSDEIKLYVDGIEDIAATGNPIAVSTGNADNVMIGSCVPSSPEFFDGSIDDVRIYDFALTEEMIEQLYQGQQPSGLICLERPVGDFTGDCIVSMPDFIFFAQEWLWEP